MNKKSSSKAAAVIEIDTAHVRMRVAQVSKGAVADLDSLEYPVYLGHDVFDNGQISFDSLRDLSSALEKFTQALASYGIQKPRVISCTALREAKNRSLVLDQLRVRNGLEVTVLGESQEKAYLFADILSKLRQAGCLPGGNTALCTVGSGSIGIAIYDGAKIVYFQNISMGAMKLHDILRNMHHAAEDLHVVVEEYLSTILNRIAFGEFSVSNLVIAGSQTELIARLCGAKETGGVHQLSTRSVKDLYKALRSLSPESISARYAIPEESAAVLYSSLAIYRAMLRFCPGTELVYSPTTDISGAVLRCSLLPKVEAARDEMIRGSALACAETTARRFGCDLTHSAYLRAISVLIFDKLRKVHGLDPSKRLVLELAAVLHSCGSFVSARRHNRCTFDLIKGMDLFGLSQQEVLETAFVAGSVAGGLAAQEDPELAGLSVKERIVVSKLAAIFGLANALDKAHRQKLTDLKVSVEDDRVVFKASASGDTLLEQWAFGEAAQLFKDVFGLSPELTVRFKLM